MLENKNNTKTGSKENFSSVAFLPFHPQNNKTLQKRHLLKRKLEHARKKQNQEQKRGKSGRKGEDVKEPLFACIGRHLFCLPVAAFLRISSLRRPGRHSPFAPRGVSSLFCISGIVPSSHNVASAFAVIVSRSVRSVLPFASFALRAEFLLVERSLTSWVPGRDVTLTYVCGSLIFPAGARERMEMESERGIGGERLAGEPIFLLRNALHGMFISPSVVLLWICS